MARTNLVPNPSFRRGAEGYSAINGASISIVSGQAFYGSEALQVTKSDRNNSGVQTGFVSVTSALKYSYSAYVLVPVTVPSSDDSNLVLTVSWYSASNDLISESTSDVVIVKPRGGWVRLTGVDVAPDKAVTARLSVTQLAAGRAKQVFFVDAMLFEQASYVGGYLDNVLQSTETQLVNAGLSTYPVPSIGGLVLDADVILGDLVLNTVDENNAVWVCTDITGWWGHSSPDVVDITRGVEDGSYDVSGRYQSRVITVSGTILLPDPSLLGAARDKLVAATNLVRKGAWLRTNESPTRAAFVRLSGRPEVETVNARGRTDFQIGLKAADPIRYEWNDEDPEGMTSSVIDLDPTITNLITNPSFEAASSGVTTTNSTVSLSTDWYSSGIQSLAVSSTAASRGDAFVDFSALVSGGLIPGVQYTASVLTHRDVTGVQNDTLVFDSFSGSVPLTTVSAQIPKEAGTRIVNLTFTVPTGATSSRLRFVSGELSGGPTVWLDDFILVVGSAPFPYFDGTTPATYSSNYTWTGTANQSSSTKKPSGAMFGTVNNKGTADVTAIFGVTGPLGAGSTIQNSSTGETITLVNELRGVGNAATVTSKELTNGIVTLTTEKPHNLVVGDIIKVAGVGSPFDAVNETLTVTAVSSLFPYSLNYARVWPDIAKTVSSGQVALAYNDVLSVDTYERSVTFNGEVRGNRSRVNTLIDWIKLVPGDNVITFTDTPNLRTVQSKSRLNNLVTLTTADAHFFIPGEEVYVSLPTNAVLAKKSLTSNVVTITTSTNHGFSVGDSVDISSTETSVVTNKALTSNVATLTTATLGAFNTGDNLVVELPVTSSVTAKTAASSVVTLTTASDHGYSVGDSVSLVVPTGAALSSKSLTNNVATLGTTTSHGFSIGDTITVSLPTTTTVTGKYTSGEAVILTTSTAHGFSIGDRVAVSLPISATTTTTRTNSGPNSYLTTITTTAAHNFVVGDRIVVDGRDRIVETVPTSTTFTFLDYSKTVSGTETVTASTVVNTTNTRLSGTFPITSVPSATQFSYNV